MSQYVLCVFLYFVPVHIVKYVYKHVLKQIVHARTLTHTHTHTKTTTRSPCVLFISLCLVFVSYRFISLQIIQSFFSILSLSLALSCTPTHSFDSIRSFSFGQSLYSLSFQFDPCAHFVSFAHTLYSSFFVEYMCVRFNDIERQRAPSK